MCDVRTTRAVPARVKGRAHARRGKRTRQHGGDKEVDDERVDATTVHDGHVAHHHPNQRSADRHTYTPQHACTAALRAGDERQLGRQVRGAKGTQSLG